MQSEERDLISGLFGRLKSFETQVRDPEAEKLIADSVAAQPATPYLLVQTVLVQEQALKAAQDRIAELEAKAAAAPAPGFLATAPKIGPWGGASVPSTPAAPKPVVAPAPAAAPVAPAPPNAGGGGGFMRQALTTAAGVAGGALLFEGIRNMLGHDTGPVNAGGTPNAAASLLPPDPVQSTDLAQAPDDGATPDYGDSVDDSGDTGADDSSDVI